MAEIHKLQPVEQPSINALLDEARAEDISALFLIGELTDGTLTLISNVNVGYALALMEFAKHSLLFEDD